MSDEGKASESVEKRLRRLEDTEELRALLLEYGRRLDSKNYEGMAELFTEDGEFHAPLGTGVGRDGILAALTKRLGPIKAGYHYYSNTDIVVDGDAATMWVMFAYIESDESGWPKALLTGHYDGTFRREHERWWFHHWKITIDIGFPPYRKPETAAGS